MNLSQFSWGYINMLRITLYQNCKLNNNYQEVFSLGKETGQSENVLERYLTNLNTLYQKLIEIPYTYYENTNELVFDYDLLVSGNNVIIYDYNYMRIREYDDDTGNLRLTRYCFINKIEIKNSVVYLSYEEDIWHSYIKDLSGFINSYLSRSRFSNYSNLSIPWKSVPIEYQSNKKLKYTKLINSVNSYHLIFELQYYTLDSEGNPTERRNKLVYALQDVESETTRYFHLEDIYSTLTEIIRLVGAGTIDQNYSFEIGDIYLIPSDFVLTSATTSQDFTIYEGTTPKIGLMEVPNTPYYFISVFTKTIANNYKNIAVGNFSSQILMKNIGLSSDLEIKAFVNEYTLKLQLEFQNQILDITDNYRIEAPFKSLLSEELSQRASSRALGNIKNILSMISSGLSIGQNLFNIGQDLQKAMIEGVSGKVSGMSGSLKSMYNQPFSIGQNILSIAKSSFEMKIRNLPIYSSTEGYFTNNVNYTNSIYGLVLFSVDSVNDTFVKDYINNIGYEVYNFVDGNKSIIDLENVDNFKTNNCNYNVVKMDYCNLYGKFTSEIARALEEIFEKGVKIWYDYQLTSDNYVI